MKFELWQFYKEQSDCVRRNTLFIVLTYFLVLFSYPLMRSATSAYFYDVYSSSDYSFATFVGVISLMFMIGVNNKLQGTLGVHKLFALTGILTVLTLLLSFWGFYSGIKEFAYAIFAIKETYIVLLLHVCLAFANSYFTIDQLKRFIGVIGGAGALGGILGGMMTSYLAKTMGTDVVFYASLVFIVLTLLAFYMTKNAKVNGLKSSKSITPLKAVRGVKKYVFLVAAIVGLSQFVIYIADLQFNIVFEQVVTEKDARTAYLGNFYTYINSISIFLQFVIMPLLLVRVSTRSIFLFIPFLYLILVIGGMSFGVGSLFIIGSVFITMKGVDYSIFNIVKEVMYHPLLNLQKFGAKYITDMFIYRAAKALIAFSMAQFMITDMKILTVMQVIFLSLWVIAIIYLFREQQKTK